MAEQHQAQSEPQRVFREDSPGERRGEKGELLDAGSGFQRHVRKRQLQAQEARQETLPTTTLTFWI